MIQCKKCKFENYDKTRYCQQCGEALHKSHSLKVLVKSFNIGSIAGIGAKGVSIAPISAMKNEQAKRPISSENSRNDKIQVIPLKDGTWFCPYCGNHNQQYELFCKNCGKFK